MAETRRLPVTSSFAHQDPQMIHIVDGRRRGAASAIVSFDMSLDAEEAFNSLKLMRRPSRLQKALRKSHLCREVVLIGKLVDVRFNEHLNHMVYPR